MQAGIVRRLCLVLLLTLHEGNVRILLTKHVVIFEEIGLQYSDFQFAKLSHPFRQWVNVFIDKLCLDVERADMLIVFIIKIQ